MGLNISNTDDENIKKINNKNQTRNQDIRNSIFNNILYTSNNKKKIIFNSISCLSNIYIYIYIYIKQYLSLNSHILITVYSNRFC